MHLYTQMCLLRVGATSTEILTTSVYTVPMVEKNRARRELAAWMHA